MVIEYTFFLGLWEGVGVLRCLCLEEVINLSLYVLLVLFIGSLFSCFRS